MDWSILIQLAVAAIAALVTAYVVPMIKDKRLAAFVAECVRAAEQIFGAGEGENKYEYVEALVTGRLNVRPEVARAAIEAAVFELNRAAE